MERNTWIAALAVCMTLGASGPWVSSAAFADSDGLDALNSLQALSVEEMATSAGGSDNDDHDVYQYNNTNQYGSNHENSIYNSGTMENGTIYGNAIQNSRGIVTVMQNSGNFSNMNNSTAVNIYMY